MSDDTILEEEAVVETKKKSKKPTSISKTIGTNIMGTITELNTISNEEALYEYLERVSEGVLLTIREDLKISTCMYIT